MPPTAPRTARSGDAALITASPARPNAAASHRGALSAGTAPFDRAAQLGAFLRTRRERLSPADVGLSAAGRRRTAGLRREEVAQLAGISAVWYTQLEQGRAVQPSRELLDVLAGVLRLDAAERAYAFQLAFGPRRGPDRRATPGAALPAAVGGLPPSVGRLLAALGPTPALLIDAYWDLVACNAAFAAVLPPFAPYVVGRPAPDAPPLNVVEFVLTDPAWRAGMRDWATVARTAVDGLRLSLAPLLASDPPDAQAAALLTRLAGASPEFRAWWPAQGLWAAEGAVTHLFDHPRVGSIELDVTLLDVRNAPGLTLLTYVPCDDASAERLRQLAAASPSGD